MRDGAVAIDDGYIVLGGLSGTSALVLDVDTGAALIDLEFQIVDNAIEDGSGAQYTELALYSIHRAFTADHSMRGDNCFYGRDNNSEPDFNYLELNEDSRSILPDVRFGGPLTETSGWFRHVRTPSRVDCTVDRPGSPSYSNGFEVDAAHATITGKIAIGADALRAKLSSVWIAYQ